MDLLEQLASPENLLSAWRAVRRNIPIARRGSSAGPDGVSITEFERDLDAHLHILSDAILSEQYRPQPPKVFQIRKSSGKMRNLVIFSIADRVAQRAAQQVLEPVWEPHFLPCSFGFRPGLSLHDAVAYARGFQESGLKWVVDGDIESCFDRLDHDILAKLVQRRVKDARFIRLLYQWLDCGVMQAAVFIDLEGIDDRGNGEASWLDKSLGFALEALDLVDVPSPGVYPDYPRGGYADDDDIAVAGGRNTLRDSRSGLGRRLLRQALAGGVMVGLNWLKPRIDQLGSKAVESWGTPAGRRRLKKGALAAGGFASVAAAAAAAAYWLNRRAGPAPQGLHQGSPLSPLLANIYLHPFDVTMRRQGFHLVRYADDWLLFSNDRSGAENALNAAILALKRLHLKPNAQKTSILEPSQPLHWLGEKVR